MDAPILFAANSPNHASSPPERTALVVVDLTNFDAHPQHGLAQVYAKNGIDLTYYWARVRDFALPNSRALLDGYRNNGGRVVFTRVGGQFSDYADSQSHIRNLHQEAATLRGTNEFEVLEEFAPRIGEAVVDKSGSSAFTTGNLDTLLRNAAVTTVVFCGVITNVCVLLSAVAAWDLGYNVRIADDACAADSPEMHEAALAVLRSLGCEVSDTASLLSELNG